MLSIGELGREALAGDQEPDYHILESLVSGSEGTNITSGTHSTEDSHVVLVSRNQGCLSGFQPRLHQLCDAGSVIVTALSYSFLISRVSILGVTALWGRLKTAVRSYGLGR